MFSSYRYTVHRETMNQMKVVVKTFLAGDPSCLFCRRGFKKRLTKNLRKRIIAIMIKLEKRKNLRLQVSERLADAIVTGELQPGERLFEAGLSRQLGVAQSTLREALQDLEHRGLVTKRENRGTFVTRLTPEEVNNIYVVRLELEPSAAVLACGRMTHEGFAQLSKHLEELESSRRARDFGNLLRADLAFHRLLWKFSGNEPLEKALNVTCAPLFAFDLMRLTSGDVSNDVSADLNDLEKDRREHYQLLDALKTRSPEEVRKIFRETLELFRKRHLEHVLAVQRSLSPTPTVDGRSAVASPSVSAS
jgi:DNA-binding GntR family transcriptional regulator